MRASVTIGLRHPIVDQLRRRLELAGQLFGPAARSHQLNHLLPELRRIRFVRLRGEKGSGVFS
jgi:hypothetical protein